MCADNNVDLSAKVFLCGFSVYLKYEKNQMVEKTLNMIDQIKCVLLVLYTEHDVAVVLNSM